MFEVAWSELLIVVIVAILVVGPKELPALLRSAGRMLGKLRRSADEFRKHFDDAVREAGAEDLQREMQALRHNNPLTKIRDSIEEASRDPFKPAPPSPSASQAVEDDLGPPPPLPPREGPSQDAALPTAPSPKPTEHLAAPTEAKDEGANGASHEVRINREHRPAG